MLKSLEIKQDIFALKESINNKIVNKAVVSEEEKEELKNLLDAYDKQIALENKKNIFKEEKGEKNKMVEKMKLNDALRNYLMGNASKLQELLNVATPNNGAVDTEGGVLVPTELLEVAENNGVRTDLRVYATNMPVSSRKGVIPTIDYGAGDVALVDFDENTEITGDSAVFGKVQFALSSKGCIIPVSRELLADAKSDVLAIIGKLINNVYAQTVNGLIVGAMSSAATAANNVDSSATTIVQFIDKIKAFVIGLPTANADAKIVVNKATWGKLAMAKDESGRYLLAKDANGATVKELEGCEVVVVENSTANVDNDTAYIGDIKAIYHINHPEVEIAYSNEAGFTKNSVLVRAVCRVQEKSVYDKAFAKVSATLS